MFIKPTKKSRKDAYEKAKLKKEYEERGITYCEIQLSPNCTPYMYLSFCHRHKRIEYKKRPEILWTFLQTILGCIPCHTLIEGDKDLTQSLFERLRPGSERLR